MGFVKNQMKKTKALIVSIKGTKLSKEKILLQKKNLGELFSSKEI